MTSAAARRGSPPLTVGRRPAQWSRSPRRRLRTAGSGSNDRVNHRSWVTAITVPSNCASPTSRASALARVEIVGRLVEQQQRRATEFEQQHQEARLLTAGERLELLIALAGEFVSVRSACICGRPVSAGTAVVTAPEDLHERTAEQIRPVVRLREVPGHHPRTESGTAAGRDRRHPRRLRRHDGRVGIGAAASEQPQGSGTFRCRSRRGRPPGRRTRSRRRTGT